jgi:hypothetical protein
MEAKAYTMCPAKLADYLTKATWAYWIIEMPHRLLLKSPLCGLQTGECLRLHCLAGRAFGPEGEFRWWRGETADEIHAMLIWDSNAAYPNDWQPTACWKQEVKCVDGQCIVWGDKAGTDNWEDPARVIPDELNELFKDKCGGAKYRGIKVRRYHDPATGELLLWRCVEPICVHVTGGHAAKEGT